MHNRRNRINKITKSSNKTSKTKVSIRPISQYTTFDNWSLKWLETYKKPNVTEYTYKWTYETNIKKYFIPYFGNKKLSSIKQIDIQEYFNLHKHLSITTLKRQVNILRGIFEEAIFNDFCSKNPVRNIKITSNKEKFITKAYNQKQAESIQKICSPEIPIQAAVYIIIATGLRRAEVLGLLWDDIDFKNRIIHVRRSLTKGKCKDTNIPQVGSVKTENSIRDIPITDDDLLEFLNRITKISPFVISGNGGSGFMPINTFETAYYNFSVCFSKKLKIPRLTPHELRHTYGSILREKGLDLLSISKLMGHSDVKVTEQHYIVNDIEVLRKRLQALK